VLEKGWALAARLEAGVRALDAGGITDARCEDNEGLLAVETVMLLPGLASKVVVRFEVGDVGVKGRGDVEAGVGVAARVVYGEKYDEGKMVDFLRKFVRGRIGIKDDLAAWAVGVEDLKGRLLRRGHKGSVV
jgi:kinetochore protein Spc7/SPC105